MLNDAIAACAFLIAVMSVPQYAEIAFAIDMPVGDEPKSWLFRIAARSCWSSCMRAWSSAVRFTPVEVLAMFAQKPPMTCSTVSGVVVHRERSASVIPLVVIPPMVVPVGLQTSATSHEWVAQKPWVLVVSAPLFVNVHVTVAPAARSLIVPVRVPTSPDAVVPPAPAVVTTHPTSVSTNPLVIPSVTVKSAPMPPAEMGKDC